MAPDSPADDRIDLPPEFADHLVSVGNVESTPETVTEMVSLFADELAGGDQTITAEDMYTETPTRHEVQVNERIRYSPCVLDALTAAMMESHPPVTVRSVDPVTNKPVTFTVTGESVTVDPDGALITFGMAPSIPDLDPDESVFAWVLRDDNDGVEEAFCQYINAFESTESYERWTASTDGQIVPIPARAIQSLIPQYVTAN